MEIRRSVIARPNLSCRDMASHLEPNYLSEDSELGRKKRHAWRTAHWRAVSFPKREAQAFPPTPSAGLLRRRRHNQVCHRLRRSKTSTYLGYRELGTGTTLGDRELGTGNIVSCLPLSVMRNQKFPKQKRGQAAGTCSLFPVPVPMACSIEASCCWR